MFSYVNNIMNSFSQVLTLHPKLYPFSGRGDLRQSGASTRLSTSLWFGRTLAIPPSWNHQVMFQLSMSKGLLTWRETLRDNDFLVIMGCTGFNTNVYMVR